MKYYVRDEKGKKIKPARKWEIVSSVTPSPVSSAKNTAYYHFLDDHDLKKLKLFMNQNPQNGSKSNESGKANKSNKSNKSSKSTKSKYEKMTRINIGRRACDVAHFLEMWTESVDQRNQYLSDSMSSSLSSLNGKGRVYNPITGNCQQFAAELFEYLVGHKQEYKQKVREVKRLAQSPWDKKKWSVDMDCQEVEEEEELDEDDDDDDAKEEIHEEKEIIVSTKGLNEAVREENHQEQKPTLESNSAAEESHTELNNPAPLQRVESL